MTGSWWDDLSECIALARWMVDTGRIGQGDVLDVIEKPHHFTAERTDMLVDREVELAEEFGPERGSAVGHRVAGPPRTV